MLQQAGGARRDCQVPPPALRRRRSRSRTWGRCTSRHRATCRPRSRRRHPTAAFMNAASPGRDRRCSSPTTTTRPRTTTWRRSPRRCGPSTRPSSRAGILLQIDAPDLAMGRHTMYQRPRRGEFLRLAARHVEVLNHALRNVPAERVRMHVCWGNYEGPHHHDIPLDELVADRAQGQAAGPAVRGRQPAPRARVGGVRGRAGARGQGADPGRDRPPPPTTSSTRSWSPSGSSASPASSGASG